MANPERILAKMHLESTPGETRTLDQLEMYYRSLSMGSPFAPLVTAFKEADAMEEARFETSLAMSKAQSLK
jgi:hypothetical protein